jgi:hypothetical protein
METVYSHRKCHHHRTLTRLSCELNQAQRAYDEMCRDGSRATDAQFIALREALSAAYRAEQTEMERPGSTDRNKASRP